MEFSIKDRYTLYDLVALVRRLRGENGCPWDRVQTHETLRRNMLEEAYEVAGAIDEDDPIHLREELGDVLLQVIFHAGIEQDAGRFDLEDVADAECKKLVSRHDHVFGTRRPELRADQVLDVWEQTKRVERSQKTVSEAMEGVAESLPGLWRAEKILKKARDAGSFLPDGDTALAGLALSADKLRSATTEEAFEKMGDLLLAAAGAALLLDVDPEMALADACRRYIERYKREEEARTE